MRRKRKKKHDEEMSESWLLPYSDLMTLLLALFIVLFASSQVDAQKFEAVSKVFGEIFHSGTGVMEYPSLVPNPNSEVSMGEGELEEELEKGLDIEKELESQTDDNQHKQLSEMEQKIIGYISENNLGNQLQTSLSNEGLLVTINDSVLFNSGSAEVRENDVAIAKEISELLVMEPPHNVIISGHTDNVPIQNSNFASNWELSVTRALNFMKIILENEQLDPRMFSAKGYGEFDPITSNDSKEGQQKNRRVEVFILPNITNTEQEAQ